MSFLIDPPWLYANGRALRRARAGAARPRCRRGDDRPRSGRRQHPALPRPALDAADLARVPGASGRDWMINSGVLRVDHRARGPRHPRGRAPPVRELPAVALARMPHGGDDRARFPASRPSGRYESLYLRAVDPSAPARGLDPPHDACSGRARRRPARSGAGLGRRRAGPPSRSRPTPALAGPARPAADRRQRGSGRTPSRAARGRPAPRRLGLAVHDAAPPLRHLPHQLAVPRAAAAHEAREPRARRARSTGTRRGRRAAARARRLARDGRPQLGRRARRALALAARRRLRRRARTRGSTSRRAASASARRPRPGSPTARCTSTAAATRLGGIARAAGGRRAPGRGRAGARRRADPRHRTAGADGRVGLRRPARRRAPRAQLLDRGARGRRRRAHARDRARRRLRAGHPGARPRRPRGPVPGPVITSAG